MAEFWNLRQGGAARLARGRDLFNGRAWLPPGLQPAG
jgi:hypothetical protein